MGYELTLLFHYRLYCHLAPTYIKFYVYHLLKWRYLKFILVYTLAQSKLLISVLLYFSGPWSSQPQCTDDALEVGKLSILPFQALYGNKYNYQSHYLHHRIIFICTIMQQLLLLWNHLRKGHTFHMITAMP